MSYSLTLIVWITDSLTNSLLHSIQDITFPEVGIYQRKQESKKTRKHAFDQESDKEKKKENTLSTKEATKKKKENTLSTKKATKNKKKESTLST